MDETVPPIAKTLSELDRIIYKINTDIAQLRAEILPLIHEKNHKIHELLYYPAIVYGGCVDSDNLTHVPHHKKIILKYFKSTFFQHVNLLITDHCSPRNLRENRNPESTKLCKSIFITGFSCYL